MRQGTLKAEIRDPKSEARKKSEIRSPKVDRRRVSHSVLFPPAGHGEIRFSVFGLLLAALSRRRSGSDFAISVFGFRAAKLMAVLLFALAFCPTSLRACAACTGRTDSPLAVAMNWGIFTLLGVVLTVLSGVLVFFVHVIRNEESASSDATPQNPPDA